ncbi:MAG TPA: PD-(D/E)XK nuclease family protein [Oscillatoriaceae cyanobacterium]
MNEPLPRLSANALTQYSFCERRFALRYKASRYWPAPEGGPEREGPNPLALGSAFHQLVHQRVLGLDLDGTLALRETELPELGVLWRAFSQSPHAVGANARLWTEQALHFAIAGVPVEVRYDRLAEEDGRWTILDWKTGRVSAKIRGTWQTKLYRYALVEAGEALTGTPIAPEQVTLVYWEVPKGHAVAFPYDADEHAAIRAELEAIAGRVTAPFDDAPADDANFKRNPDHCGQCPFDAYCNRAPLPLPASAQRTLPRFIS